MTTKVDPTVEKKRYEIKCYKCGHLLRTYTVPYYYDDEMEQECYCYNCFSNSVQEAKAEERERIEDKIKVETAKALADLNQEFPDKMTAGGGLVGRVVPERERYLKTKRAVLLDLLASLEQEEGK